MCNQQRPNQIAHFTNLLPEWGQAADEIYQNYHFLNLALSQTDNVFIPEEALQKLAGLKKMLVNTIATLIQDLPSTTHRLSNENSQSATRFNAHTITLQKVNQQTDAFFEEILQQYPSLKNWFDSITKE
jgi:hypothetical protein